MINLFRMGINLDYKSFNYFIRKMRNEVVSTEDEDDENFSENPKSNVNDNIAR